jgi:outer membrane protein TolC
VENLRPEVIRAENNYALSIDGLRAAMGIGVSEAIEIEGKLDYKPVPEERMNVETVTELNPSIQALRLQVLVNEAFVSAERSNFIPTLSAFGNIQYQAAKNTFTISTADFFRSAQVGLTLSLNIFQGFQTNARMDQANVDVRKSEEQLASVETSLRTAAHSAVLQLQQARQRVEAQGKTVEQAERGYRIATTRFINGSGTQLEVNDAQLALTQAKVNRIQSVYDHLVASADLDFILGRLPDNTASTVQ